ncbi:Thioesterase/thiol ester dehydrase-isomerase [Venturia nashicola]|uniref:Thioesterase/thiol ester dehydrase-isomerase n=1 Tax=Venturia nashicola TaxID=86259 RepID=A0A4Z1NX36_9PEZI|nr:Thioesterase/thiol ester dehydrase-isomerase [Venturia nashicola]TLD22615.1 Thioesterase/thiol ester dehydrase-isomerase [Venturia nashicola]
MSLSRRPAGSLSTTCRCASRHVFQKDIRAATAQLHNPCTTQSTRGFSFSASKRTDGVFRELTSARVPTPWIEALKRKEAGLEVNEVVSDTNEAREKRLEGKRMSESYHSVVLPLARDPWLGDTYLNSSGHIRVGTLLMDLDALSGVIAYKHTGPDVTTVTAAFDRITIINPLKEICDLELSGQVTYATGRSSMEISLQVAKAPKEGEKVEKEDILISCTCTMVSLDSATKKPVNINPLIVETEEEKRLYAAGERNSKQKKEVGKVSLLKQTPNDEESDIIHALWQKQIQWHDPTNQERKPSIVASMDQTVLRTAAIMQPQFRNRHHFMIFGGFLLKQTFELAFCCAASFSHSRPSFLSLDPSTFHNPVPVGSVLYLTATVTYTDPPVLSSPGDVTSNVPTGKTRVQVRVDSKVRNVEHGVTKPTGQFNFSFEVDREVRVMPKTYTEFMMYIDARRRAVNVAKLAGGGEIGVTE